MISDKRKTFSLSLSLVLYASTDPSHQSTRKVAMWYVDGGEEDKRSGLCSGRFVVSLLRRSLGLGSAVRPSTTKANRYHHQNHCKCSLWFGYDFVNN